MIAPVAPKVKVGSVVPEMILVAIFKVPFTVKVLVGLVPEPIVNGVDNCKVLPLFTKYWVNFEFAPE